MYFKYVFQLLVFQLLHNTVIWRKKVLLLLQERIMVRLYANYLTIEHTIYRQLDAESCYLNDDF